jgi:isoquinoline 1-oxidoreductase beta subunit
VTEGFMDELAAAAKQDPVAYRLALLENTPRAKAVLALAPKRRAGGRSFRRGSAGACRCRTASRPTWHRSRRWKWSKDGAVRVRRVVCAVDCGTVINPDIVRAQIQSAIMFGITAALYGESTMKDGKIEQTNFDSYRILRMNEAPEVVVHIVRSQALTGGMGEAGTSAVVPAVVNAIFAATGKRLRKLPVDPAGLQRPG